MVPLGDLTGQPHTNLTHTTRPLTKFDLVFLAWITVDAQNTFLLSVIRKLGQPRPFIG